jgi:hypothetical protein
MLTNTESKLSPLEMLFFLIIFRDIFVVLLGIKISAEVSGEYAVYE